MTHTFTAMCHDTNGVGTIWVDSVQAEDFRKAIPVARERCAADWDVDIEDVHCLAIAAGDVHFPYFDDSHLESKR